MKKQILMAVCLLTCISCSRKVYVYFPKEAPDIIPTAGFNYHYKTVSIKSANQTIVYSANELSSQINVFINVIQREFKMANIKVVEDTARPDLRIEFIGFEPYELHTNETVKPNGKKKIIPCDYKQGGVKAYIKVIDRNLNSVDFTFYYVPCTTGCVIDDYGYFCDGKVKKGKSNTNSEAYKVSLDRFPTEVMGKRVAKSLMNELSSLRNNSSQ